MTDLEKTIFKEALEETKNLSKRISRRAAAVRSYDQKDMTAEELKASGDAGWKETYEIQVSIEKQLAKLELVYNSLIQ